MLGMCTKFYRNIYKTEDVVCFIHPLFEHEITQTCQRPHQKGNYRYAPTDRPTDRSTNPPTDRPTEQLTDRPTPGQADYSRQW